MIVKEPKPQISPDYEKLQAAAEAELARIAEENGLMGKESRIDRRKLAYFAIPRLAGYAWKAALLAAVLTIAVKL